MSKARIGYARESARHLLRMGMQAVPPINLNALVRLKGLQIKEIKGAEERWSGTMYPIQRIVAVNSNHHLNRRRFTIAHELGHFCLNHDLNDLIDFVGYEGSFGSGNVKDDFDVPDLEREANEFASELLIPLAMIKKDYAVLPVPKQLAQRYQVSETAMFVSLLKHRIFK